MRQTLFQTRRRRAYVIRQAVWNTYKVKHASLILHTFDIFISEVFDEVECDKAKVNPQMYSFVLREENDSFPADKI